MMKVPSQINISVNGPCVSHSRVDAKARNHTIIIDEPPARGGTDLGMSPLETYFSAYAGCLNVIANTIIGDMAIDVEITSVDIAVVFETAAYIGKAKVDRPFSEIKAIITAKVNCSDDDLAALKRDLAWRCPISATFIAAGMNLKEEWVVS